MKRLLFAVVAAAALALGGSAASRAQTAHDPSHHPEEAEGEPAPEAGGQGMMAPGGMPMMRQPGMMGQGGMPMMRQQGMMGHGPLGMPFEHVEGRIAFLKAEIGITEAQQPHWSAFADAFRKSALQHRTMHRQMMSRKGEVAWQDRIAGQAQAMANRAEALKALAAAAKPLFESLTEPQKAVAERLLSGPMGMN